MTESYYMIRCDSMWQYTISKWDGGVRPVDVYVIKVNDKKKQRCSCMAGRYRGYCKHTGMLKAWINRGMPEGEEIRL